MQRVQVQLTKEQVDALAHRAADSGHSVASLVREAVDAWLAERDRRRRIERALASIGGFHSGLGDLAENHDRYIDEAPGS
jgi:Arc/MetJ-type ribon-helix-helix transcriptional regulator